MAGNEIEEALHSKSVFNRSIRWWQNDRIDQGWAIRQPTRNPFNSSQTHSAGPKPIQLVPKHRFLQISQQRSLNSKKSKTRSAFIFGFWFWEDPPHPVNWSSTHSTGPQKPFFTEISVSVAQMKKIQKT